MLEIFFGCLLEIPTANKYLLTYNLIIVISLVVILLHTLVLLFVMSK
jgi:hypothetical protein